MLVSRVMIARLPQSWLVRIAHSGLLSFAQNQSIRDGYNALAGSLSRYEQSCTESSVLGCHDQREKVRWYI